MHIIIIISQIYTSASHILLKYVLSYWSQYSKTIWLTSYMMHMIPLMIGFMFFFSELQRRCVVQAFKEVVVIALLIEPTGLGNLGH